MKHPPGPPMTLGKMHEFWACARLDHGQEPGRAGGDEDD
jgi:hypothetical protein